MTGYALLLPSKPEVDCPVLRTFSLSMKQYSFLFVLSVVAAGLGFGVVSGTAAIILRIFSAVLLVSFGIGLLHSRRVRLANQPVPATFATSFRPDTEKR